MTPNAPSATDSGLTASSTWAATTEVAWISYAAPRGRVRMNSCSTVRATPLPRSSWSPYSTGAAAWTEFFGRSDSVSGCTAFPESPVG